MVVGLALDVVEGVAQEVDVAALLGSFAEYFPDRPDESVVVVADHELDAVQAALAPAGEKRLLAAAALAAGEFDAEDLAVAIPADADGDQHRLEADHTVLAHLISRRVSGIR